MRNFINIIKENEIEDDDFDYGIDPSIEDQPVRKPQPYEFLNGLQRYKALKHDARKNDREKWRKKQQKRFMM